VKQARADLEALFESDATLAVSAKDIEDIQLARTRCSERAQQTLKPWRAEATGAAGSAWDALAEGETTTISELQEELSDFLYYATTNA